MEESITAWVPTGENPSYYLLKFFMGQIGDILWGMYCMIATMNISN